MDAFRTSRSIHIFYHGIEFKTSEHLYQALKMSDISGFHMVRKCPTPKAAKELAYTLSMVSNWELIKYDTMLQVLQLKFDQHDSIHDILLDTNDMVIEEASPYDYIWGTGKDGSGKNLLGKAWMQIREDNNDV